VGLDGWAGGEVEVEMRLVGSCALKHLLQCAAPSTQSPTCNPTNPNTHTFPQPQSQTGFGRTGDAYWGFQLQGVTPDIVTMAKGIGNGLPLAAVVTTPEVAAALTKRIHFNTCVDLGRLGVRGGCGDGGVDVLCCSG